MTNYILKTPVDFNDSEALKALVDRVKSQGEVLHIATGQEPTLTEMSETIVWASNVFEPSEVEFEIDPTYTGEREYLQVYQYLINKGFSIKAPYKKKVVNVEPFNPETLEIPAIITEHIEAEQSQTSNSPTHGEPLVGIAAYRYPKQVDLTTAIFGAVTLASVATTLTLLFSRGK